MEAVGRIKSMNVRQRANASAEPHGTLAFTRSDQDRT